MHWNWQLPDWPKFRYNPELIAQKERQLLLSLGGATAFLKGTDRKNYNHYLVEILSQEGAESSKIEGEILDRESLQSSIKKHFGLSDNAARERKKESGVADLLCDVYDTFQLPLTHEQLWNWHAMLFKGQPQLEDLGRYRTHLDPMQIVSRRYGHPRVFFEAPPSGQVPQEMGAFIDWFNSVEATSSILGRAAIAHVYFESIHPFEDGNGRIGRVIVEKALSQAVGRPTLIAVSRVLEERRKDYYAALERCNRTLEVDHWVEFFADAVLQAAEESMRLLTFLIEKTKIFTALSGLINPRQEQALLRMFEAGPKGFIGGLSAEKYIAITKASRATATRDLAELVKIGALVKTGELRHTRYWLSINT